MIKLKVEGLAETQRKFQQRNANFRDALRQGLYAAAIAVSSETKRVIMKGDRHGYKYKWRAARKGEKPDGFLTLHGHRVPVKRLRDPHVASAPGEPPKSASGNLVHQIRPRLEGQLSAEVVAGTRYAKWLEKGCKTMQARPFMAVTLEAQRDRVRFEIMKAVKGALR